MVKVLNKKLSNEEGVYIGRPSPFGNPFVIGVDGNRTQVIQKYENWIKNNPELLQKAKSELKGKNLICWCAPLACHGDILLKLVNDNSNTPCS
jgi:hypothetical protein